VSKIKVARKPEAINTNKEKPSQPALKNQDNLKLQVYLAEYQALRGEILERLEQQKSLTNFALVALGGIIAFVGSQFFMGGGPDFSFNNLEEWQIIFFLIVPWLFFSLIFVYLRHDFFIAALATCY